MLLCLQALYLGESVLAYLPYHAEHVRRDTTNPIFNEPLVSALRTRGRRALERMAQALFQFGHVQTLKIQQTVAMKVMPSMAPIHPARTSSNA